MDSARAPASAAERPSSSITKPLRERVFHTPGFLSGCVENCVERADQRHCFHGACSARTWATQPPARCPICGSDVAEADGTAHTPGRCEQFAAACLQAERRRRQDEQRLGGVERETSPKATGFSILFTSSETTRERLQWQTQSEQLTTTLQIMLGRGHARVTHAQAIVTIVLSAPHCLCRSTRCSLPCAPRFCIRA